LKEHAGGMKRAESLSSDRESKRVRISEEKPAAHLTHLQQNDALSEQERSESWWTHSEYTEAKDTVKEVCRGHRQARRYSDCLSNAYQTACAMASSTVEEDTSHQQKSPDTTPVAPELPPPDEVSFKVGKIACMHYYSFQSSSFYRSPTLQGLLRWAEDQGPRGLEGYSSRLHGMRRQQHMQDTKHAVFLEQARQSLSNERDDEELARQAELVSRRARTFAKLLGHADAWAVRSSENQHKCKEQTKLIGDGSHEVSDDSDSALS
jgi:hypothetical protein